MMEHRIGIYLCFMALMVGMNSPIAAGAADGIAQGEISDATDQRGPGLAGSGSSNVMKGGPEIIEGEITRIQGEHYSVRETHGQNITLRVTKDTNKVCATGQGTQFSTGQEGAKEHQEIAPTTSMQKQRAKGEQDTMQSPQSRSTKETGALSKDPSALQDVVGTTDSTAKEDVARGSGFIVGGADCKFRPGDQVRIEGSDMGTATTIKQVRPGSGG